MVEPFASFDAQYRTRLMDNVVGGLTPDRCPALGHVSSHWLIIIIEPVQYNIYVHAVSLYYSDFLMILSF